jgi:hypothetical protein
VARRYPVTISNDVPYVRTPLPVMPGPPPPVRAQRHSVPRVLWETVTGRGARGSGGYVPRTVIPGGGSSPAQATGAQAEPCEGCT